MDALSDVLRVVRLKGGVFLNAEFSAPRCISMQVAPGAHRVRLPGSDRLEDNPLVGALPPVLRSDTRQGVSGSWMKSSFEFAVDEMEARRAHGNDMTAQA